MRRVVYLFCFVLGLAGELSAARKPNVLFLFTDDQRADTVSALGNPSIITPNLDRIARTGFVFNNAYCMGSTMPAVCNPSRHMMLSGASLFRYNPKRLEGTMADVMNRAGYVTWHIGKRGNTAREYHKAFHHSSYVADDQERTSGYHGRAAADKAVNFLQNGWDRAKPLFMFVAFEGPHDPRVAAKEWLELYDRDKIPLPKNYRPFHPFDNGELLVRDEKLAPWPRTEAVVHEHLHDYYACISSIDHQIGRIFRALEELNEFDNTIVIFSSDHGLAIGSHGLFGKQNLYEDGMKVPLILAGPGIPKGRSDAFAYLFDLLPTIAELSGATVPSPIDGLSLVPIMRDPKRAMRDAVFLAYRDVQRAVRKGDWKLIRYPKVNYTQLFNLAEDPDENRNLASDRQHAEKVAELMQVLAAEQKRWGDTAPLTVANPAPAAVNESYFTARPNVLFIGVDDLNDWIGCLGSPVKTPHIDRLASRGTLFANAHCQSPLCNPSRASLLTGLRPSTTGIYNLAPGIRAVESTKDAVTLPQYFKRNGYFTFTAGKIFHDGSIPAGQRTNEFEVWQNTPGMPYPKAKFVNTPDTIRAMDWGVFPENDSDQADWKIADAAVEQLRSLPPNRPFFLAVGFRLPHVPCFASQKWFDLYPEQSLVLPVVKQNDRDDVPEFAWFLHWKLPEPRLSWLVKANQWRPLVRAYMASTSFMDSQVGRVLDALEASGRADNTIVVLWSDHGWHLGEKGITGKNSLWERSTRVPLVFAGPGVARAAKCSQPVELLDLYPTLVELCGLPKRTGLEGQSLAPQLRNALARRETPAITTHNHNNHSVRSEHWRYIRYADGSEELYDHRVDPHEWTNLAGNPQHAPVIREHAKWLPKVNASAAPGSAARVLMKTNGVWFWEGKPIKLEELER